MPSMKAAIFVEPGRIVLDDKPIPDIGPLDALIKVTTTTICGTDIHILKATRLSSGSSRNIPTWRNLSVTSLQRCSACCSSVP